MPREGHPSSTLVLLFSPLAGLPLFLEGLPCAQREVEPCGVTSIVAPMSQEAGTREADQAGYVLCSGHLVTSGMEIDSPVSFAFLIIKLYILRRCVFTCTTVRTDSEPSCVPLPSFPKGSISQSCSTMSHPGYQRWMQSKFRLLLSRGCTFVATPTSLLPSPS